MKKCDARWHSRTASGVPPYGESQVIPESDILRHFPAYEPKTSSTPGTTWMPIQVRSTRKFAKERGCLIVTSADVSPKPTKTRARTGGNGGNRVVRRQFPPLPQFPPVQRVLSWIRCLTDRNPFALPRASDDVLALTPKWVTVFEPRCLSPWNGHSVCDLRPPPPVLNGYPGDRFAGRVSPGQATP
jgi:hypothetical protein